MSPEPDTLIDLLRHGEPVGGRRYRGQIDDPLSDKGWQQMRAAVAGREDWDVIWSSTLSRCAEFARELAAQRQLPLTLDARLREIGFGAWEGQTPDELRRTDPERLDRFWRDPLANRPAGAEALTGFRARVQSAWNDMVAAHAGQRVLVVGHAGITRMLVSLALGSPVENMFRIHVGNAELTRIRVRGRGAEALPQLVFHGQ